MQEHTAAPAVRLDSDVPTTTRPQLAQANRLSSSILFGAVAVAPLPFGSTDPTTIAFWCIALGLALTIVTPRALNGRQFMLLALVGVIVVAYGVVLREQLSSHPWFAVSHPLWKEAAEALRTPIEPSVSIARNQPFSRWARRSPPC
jgi:hypothetical protein